jgi:hypothetical protein
MSPDVPASVAGTGSGVDTKAGQVQIQYLKSASKSREACEVRDQIRQAKMQIDGIAMQLCYIESQKGLTAGGKYKMKFKPPTPSGGPALALQELPPGGPTAPTEPPTGAPGGQMPDPSAGGPPPAGAEGEDMTLSVFLDNSAKEKFTVYMCDNGKLSQKIELVGAAGSGSKGAYKAVISGNGMDASIKGAFDNGVGLDGHQRLSTQMTFKMDMGGMSNFMRSTMDLDLVKDAVSIVKVATESSTSSTDFSNASKELGTSYVGPNLGAALFQRSLDGDTPSIFAPPGGDSSTTTDPSGDAILPPGDGAFTDASTSSNTNVDTGTDINTDFNTDISTDMQMPPLALTEAEVETSRAYFDSAGNKLEPSASKSFEEGGALHIKETDLPKLLPENFSVSFDPTDWDCSGTEDIAMDTSSDAFKACAEKFAAEIPTETCDGGDFVVGVEASDVPPAIDAYAGDTPDLIGGDQPQPAPGALPPPEGGAPVGDGTVPPPP